MLDIYNSYVLHVLKQVNCIYLPPYCVHYNSVKVLVLNLLSGSNWQFRQNMSSHHHTRCNVLLNDAGSLQCIVDQHVYECTDIFV